MLKVRILSGEVFSREVVASKTGKRYVFRDQVAVATIGSESAPCRVSLRDDQPPYAVGAYEVLETSFYIDRDGKFALGRLALRALQDAAGNAAAGPAGLVPALPAQGARKVG